MTRDVALHTRAHADRLLSMPRRIDWALLAVLFAALIVRCVAWLTLPYHDFISDEAEYWGAATWLAQGRGFAFFDTWIWTRPPVYPLFLAAHIRLFGLTTFWAPRITQAVLSVILVYLVIQLGQRLAPPGLERQVGLLAGWAMACSYSFATFAYLLLSETVFITLLVSALLALVQWAPHNIQVRAVWGRQGIIQYRWLLIAGVLLGLCVLTKAIVLTWLPLVVLWVMIRALRCPDIRCQGKLRHWLQPVVLFIVAVCTFVIPWSIYSTDRWGYGDGIILVDTTGGYNFALGAQTGYLGRRDENALHDALCDRTLCNAAQAQRQRVAYALGWQWIQLAPHEFIIKTGRELLDMVQLHSGGAERLESGYTLGEIPLAHLLGLLSDDTLYVITLPLAMIGLLRTQGRSGKALVVSWLLYNVIIGALIFAINRFRQPLLPFIFIYAACAIAQWRATWTSRRRHIIAWAMGSAFMLLILPSYLYWPPILDPNGRSVLQDTLLGIQGLRSADECASIEQIRQNGDVTRARTLHDIANERQPRPCLAIINARLLQDEDKISGTDGALAFLARSAPTDNPDQAAKILMLEGDLLRRLGRYSEAKDRFVSRSVEIINDLDWAWENLQPPMTTTVDLGAGLDYGYIRGFYKREGVAEQPNNYRWSEAESIIRFPQAGTGQPQRLILRANGYTIESQPTSITPQVGQVTLPALVLLPAWKEYTLMIPSTPAGLDVVVTFHAPVFMEGPAGLAEQVRASNRKPLRLLGFQLDWALLQK